MFRSHMKFLSTRKVRSRLVFLLLAVFFLSTLASCADIGYYTRASRGHLQILKERQSIESLLACGDTSPELRLRLEKVLEIREFASHELDLPDNGSYRCYADIKRPHVIWNVVATPEFDLRPVTWCFPVAGCVSYRGFFTPEEAETFAEGLRKQGHDVLTYGVSAYSTLGWFADPVLNTFVNRSDTYLASLIFHELAHQKLYIKNDSTFNESFAQTVELEGVMRWLAQTAGEEAVHGYLEEKARDEQWVQLISGAQQKLRTLYAGDLSPDAMRADKERIYRELIEDYEQLKVSWGGFSGYDRWFSQNLNNAKLASVDTYRSYVPSFRQLLHNHRGDLAAFYQEARSLGRLPDTQRLARLEELRAEYLALQPPAPPETPPQRNMAEAIGSESEQAVTEGG